MGNTIPVRIAARELGVVPSRIRQLCVEYGIGRLLSPTFRVLTRTDVNRLRLILTEPKQGRSRKKWRRPLDNV